jgi:mediator of RNA polymerase II transcription subunit 14
VTASHIFIIAFPRSPTGITKRFIADEADARLAHYITTPEIEASQTQPAEPESQPDPSQIQPQPTRPKLPENVVDAPLTRLYNFMRK